MVNKELIQALDLLIKKYSEPKKAEDSRIDCPLCDIFLLNSERDLDPSLDSCTGCPNIYFHSGSKIFPHCSRRSELYPSLNYHKKGNYPTLKQFWMDYKELYLQGYDNDTIMGTLVEPFKVKKDESKIN